MEQLVQFAYRIFSIECLTAVSLTGYGYHPLSV
jgi:hypothetical protein